MGSNFFLLFWDWIQRRGQTDFKLRMELVIWKFSKLGKNFMMRFFLDNWIILGFARCYIIPKVKVLIQAYLVHI